MRIRSMCAFLLSALLMTAGSSGQAQAAAGDGGKTGAFKQAATLSGSPTAPVVYASRTIRNGDLVLQLPEKAEQGGVLLVRALVNGAVPGQTVEFRCGGKKIAAAELLPPSGPGEAGGEALALLPVAPDAPVERGVRVEVRSGKLSASVTVPVVAVAWPRQKITVSQKYVDPPQTVMERIKRDREHTKAALSRVSAKRSWKTPFVRPVPGSVSSSFGGKRMFNGQMRSYHRGVDLRGAEGTPVRAAADGTVLLAEDQYFSGNIVLVDHGQGLVTLYCHLSAMHVKAGDKVSAGQELGLVGATGRVTGPHLHLGALLGGQPVNPLALLALE